MVSAHVPCAAAKVTVEIQPVVPFSPDGAALCIVVTGATEQPGKAVLRTLVV